MNNKQMRKINKIILHCTATPEGRHTTVEDIRRWHKAQGWSDIGYHYVVYLDGSVHEGRPVDIVGAHTKGHNTGSISVVYVGGIDKMNLKPKDTRTEEQKEALHNGPTKRATSVDLLIIRIQKNVDQAKE
jgi:N-acetylmuramoyl-L-alanine amidase